MTGAGKPPRATCATRPAAMWGLPDWRDPAAYGDVMRWSFNRWRWEFYRRRDDLRAAFTALRADEPEKISRLLDEVGTPFSPSGRPSPGTPGYCVASHGRWCRETFGYETWLPDPSVSNHPDELLFSLEDWPAELIMVPSDHANTLESLEFFGGVSLSEDERAKLDWLEGTVPVRSSGENDLVVVFDVSRPLGPQLTIAKRALSERQSAIYGKPLQRRRHPAKWLGYLRTLDAREDLASWAEIAALHPKTAQSEQTARDIWEQARALCFNF